MTPTPEREEALRRFYDRLLAFAADLEAMTETAEYHQRQSQEQFARFKQLSADLEAAEDQIKELNRNRDWLKRHGEAWEARAEAAERDLATAREALERIALTEKEPVALAALRTLGEKA